MEKDYQKAFKKLILFFLLNPVPFNEESYQKQGSGTNVQSPFMSWNKKKKKNSFICYILSDKIWWYNVEQFLSYSKNYICKFMQFNSWHHKLFDFHLSFWIWKVWKGGEEITKIWKSWEWKELFRWNKKRFSQFLKGYPLVKK